MGGVERERCGIERKVGRVRLTWPEMVDDARMSGRGRGCGPDVGRLLGHQPGAGRSARFAGAPVPSPHSERTLSFRGPVAQTRLPSRHEAISSFWVSVEEG